MNLPENTKKVFISWTGKLGREIADNLKREMLNFANLEPWVSDDIMTGANWFQETERALDTASYGIVCLTPGSSKRPWLNFEAGFIYGRLKNCILVTFGEKDIMNPLGQLQTMDGRSSDKWVELLAVMLDGIRSKEECRAWVEVKFRSLETIFNRCNELPYKYLTEMDRMVGEIQHIVDRKLKKSENIRNNNCLQHVILYSYREMQARFREDGVYTAPASQYPQYLISLQRVLNPVVNAVALINVEEDFWQQTQGKDILLTANRQNSRVFVFTSDKEFIKMSETLKKHAIRYNVYAISYSQLSKEFSYYTKDFSIIETSNGKLLAEYDTAKDLICFNPDEFVIAEHEAVIGDIIKHAVSLPHDNDISDGDINLLTERIFNCSNFVNSNAYDRKTIEMSLYIDVEDYDKHEENHAYYREMMDRMLEIFSSHFRLQSPPYRVLEFGAGTGIFTSWLANQSSIGEIVAIEIDWHCYKKLEYKFRNQKERIKAFHEDSRTYNPEGKFDCIFSSFADHHIRERDKEQYFQNVKRNLKTGGLVIVGDEFLRTHNSSNEDERTAALEAYHHHIIKKAEEAGDEILVKLESLALESGIKKTGDFKVSCERYEQLLQQAGFKIEGKERIGPQEGSEKIGGVYVYTIRV